MPQTSLPHATLAFSSCPPWPCPDAAPCRCRECCHGHRRAEISTAPVRSCNRREGVAGRRVELLAAIRSSASYWSQFYEGSGWTVDSVGSGRGGERGMWYFRELVEALGWRRGYDTENGRSRIHWAELKGRAGTTVNCRRMRWRNITPPGRRCSSAIFSHPFPESQGNSLWQVEVQELQEQSVKHH